MQLSSRLALYFQSLSAEWARRTDQAGDGVGPRWKGLDGRRSTDDGQLLLPRDGAGEGFIAREIREQRERELQLMLQRRQAAISPNNGVTSPCPGDDISSVTSSSVGEQEPEIHARDNNDVNSDHGGQPMQPTDSGIDGSAAVAEDAARCADVGDGGTTAPSSDQQLENLTPTQTTTMTTSKLCGGRLQERNQTTVDDELLTRRIYQGKVS